MINPVNLNHILCVLDVMVQYETGLSELYQICAEVAKEDEALWRHLSREEIHHANNIMKIKKILTEKPDRFEIGRPFNLAALNTALAGVRDVTGRILRGELSRDKMLFTARDFENSVLESHYADIVRSTDVEYQNLMRGILSQTYKHKKAIQEAIDAIKAKT